MLPTSGGSTRRFVFALILGAFALSFFFVGMMRHAGRQSEPFNKALSRPSLHIRPEILSGHAIAPKLGNETAKAELGRAAWKLFHTTFARFPDKPSADESLALDSYIHLFARLYPCGECAQHFQQILQKFPPQVSTRSDAAAWGCHVHNEVNKSLKKELFDCSNIGDFYDCGCAGNDEGLDTKEKPDRAIVSIGGLNGESGNTERQS